MEAGDVCQVCLKLQSGNWISSSLDGPFETVIIVYPSDGHELFGGLMPNGDVIIIHTTWLIGKLGAVAT